jgi:hypothetical protein
MKSHDFLGGRTLIYRYMYCSYLKLELTADDKSKLVAAIQREETRWRHQGLITLSCFHLHPVVCIYLESEGAEEWFHWSADVAPWFHLSPSLYGMRNVIRMSDIFHDGVPMDVTGWRKERAIEQRVGSLARIRSDQLASYVFYHYQLQEEVPESFNKTYTIGLQDQLIFSYYELPAVVCEPRPKGKLQSQFSSLQNWQEVMDPHFEMWPTSEGGWVPWLTMEHLCTLSGVPRG